MRLPPTLDSKKAATRFKEIITSKPPYNCEVIFDPQPLQGWDSPACQPWLNDAIQDSSTNFFGKKSLSLAMGGAIPLLGELGEKYPKAQFATLGLLGPGANAHGPNEFLEIQYCQKLLMCITFMLAKSFEHLKK